MEASVVEWLTPPFPDLEVRGSSPTRRVFSLDKELYSTLSLFTQVYKWVPATYSSYSWGITLQWTSIPPGGKYNTPRCFMLMKPVDRVCLYLFTLPWSKLANTIQFNMTINNQSLPLLISKVFVHQPWSTGSTLVRTQTFFISISLRSVNRNIDSPVVPY